MEGNAVRENSSYGLCLETLADGNRLVAVMLCFGVRFYKGESVSARDESVRKEPGAEAHA